MKIWHPCQKWIFVPGLKSKYNKYNFCGKEGWRKAEDGKWLCEEHANDNVLIAQAVS